MADTTGTVSLTGDDNFVLNNGSDHIFKDFADGAIVELNFPDKLVDSKFGKNGNTIYAFKASGKKVEVNVRVLAGSKDDKWLNSELTKYLQNPPGYILLSGEFIKRVGDGKGNVTNIVYSLEGGLCDAYPKTSENVDGDSEQAVSVYTLLFTNPSKIMG